MFDFFFKIWYMAIILPILVFAEGNKMLANYLKRNGIYSHWDSLHAWLVVLIIILIVMLAGRFWKI